MLKFKHWLKSPTNVHFPFRRRPSRRFPPPVVCRTASHQRGALSYIYYEGERTYYESEPGRRSAAKLLSEDEVRRIAANIAKLPELLTTPQPNRKSLEF